MSDGLIYASAALFIGAWLVAMVVMVEVFFR